MNVFNSLSLNVMDKGLDGLAKRQKAIANNVANYETPGYKRQYVTFENELKQQIEKQKLTNKEKIENIKQTMPTLKESNDLTDRADGNNVDIELENTELARTSLQYMYLTRQMSDHFSRLRHAISEGRK